MSDTGSYNKNLSPTDSAMDKGQAQAGQEGAAPQENLTSQVKTPDSKKNDLSQSAWEHAREDGRWDSTPGGRGAIRLVSRGILGAAAFAWGSKYAGKGFAMAGYSPDNTLKEILERDFLDPRVTKNKVIFPVLAKSLQVAAKSIDTLAGRPIKFVASFFSEDPERWVRFRHTHNTAEQIHGRSLGHEAVGLTFDFFCASVADAAGRDAIDALDPHVKHRWKDEKGFHPLEALKQTGKSLFQYITYNGGEDWAVAVPYAYFVRGQRAVINKFSPRFKYDSDRGLNGGSFKIDNEGNVIGNYNLEGMIDLQGRFTFYNTGTLMFRELYNNVENILTGKPTCLYGDPLKKDNTHHGFTDTIGDLAKWTARSAVKGVITMSPAIPFFHFFRTPQSKYKGLFISQDIDNGGVLGYVGEDGREHLVHANELDRTNKYFRNNNPEVKFAQFNNGAWDEYAALKNHPLSNKAQKFAPYGHVFGAGDSFLNAIGKAQNNIRSKVNDMPNMIKLFGSKRVVDNYVNAAFAYTPYMAVKRETAIAWDNGKMDMAAERMIDGAAKLNWKEFKAGAGEVWKAVLHEPFDDPQRERLSSERILNDPSPAYGITRKQAHELAEKATHPLTWKERIVQGRIQEDRGTEERTNLKAKPVEKRKEKYADDEIMRQMLHDLQPPTNSVH